MVGIDGQLTDENTKMTRFLLDVVLVVVYMIAFVLISEKLVVIKLVPEQSLFEDTIMCLVVIATISATMAACMTLVWIGAEFVEFAITWISKRLEVVLYISFLLIIVNATLEICIMMDQLLSHPTRWILCTILGVICIVFASLPIIVVSLAFVPNAFIEQN